MKIDSLMKIKPCFKLRWVVLLLTLLIFYGNTKAAPWNGIEPLKSRRTDVERILGKPIQDVSGKSNTLRYKIAGGTVTVAFVDAKFVVAKKLPRGTEGTVLQIVLQHDNAKDTPESLELNKNPEFTKEAKQSAVIFRNAKEGIVYTFIEGRLKTTWYTISSRQLGSTRINTVF
jgi:hypothetical protein